jgi:muramoyltetrapeptide carboxypeptidase
VPGTAYGRLWGGNLSLLASDVGIEPVPADPVIMVIEEVGEDGYRLDRMLTQLRRAGWLDQVSGVVVGDLGGDPLALDVVRHCLADLDVPMIDDVPVGHGARNLALPLGAPIVLDADASVGTLRLASWTRKGLDECVVDTGRCRPESTTQSGLVATRTGS